MKQKNGQEKVAVKTDFDGVITGVNYTPEGPVLLVGTQTVKLKDVKKIVDPSLRKNGQNIQNAPIQDLQNSQGAAKNKEKVNVGAQEAAPKAPILDNVGMSREMMNEVANAMKPPAKSSNQAQMKPESKTEALADDNNKSKPPSATAKLQQKLAGM